LQRHESHPLWVAFYEWPVKGLLKCLPCGGVPSVGVFPLPRRRICFGCDYTRSRGHEPRWTTAATESPPSVNLRPEAVQDGCAGTL